MYAVNGQVETHRKVFRWRFRTKGKEILNLCACFTCCLSLCGLLAAPALANPSGGTVTAGSATISSSGDTLSINQSSSRAVIEWSGFDISAGETTQFIQPSSSAVTLNRVVNATQASVINGNLLANGKVLVINPNGVLIGPKGNVDVAGFIASSADIGDGDFMNATGAMHFDRAGRADAVVENRGRITIRDEGLGLLVAPEVRNSGVIEGNLSRIQLAAGDVFGVDLYGDGLLSLAVKDDGKARSLKAENAGTITANAGKVLLTAAAANNVVNSVINTSGVIEAQGLVAKGGEVILTGADAHVGVSGRISVNGKTGGGTVKIGTETATQAKAATVDIAPDAVISADALENGNGGAIAIWSDESTGAHGSFTARGGAAGGDGGFIETSATDVLDFSGARVDTSAPQGAFGTWLLDPTSTDITDATAINGAASDVSLGGTDRVTISTDINMTTAGVSLSLTAGGSGISMSNHYIRTNGGDVTWSTSGVAKVDYGAIYTRGGAVSITGDTLTLNNSGIGTGGGAVALTATANPTGGGTKTLSLNSTNIDATGGAASGGISFYDGNPRALFTGADAQAADRLGNGNTFESSVDGGAVTLSGKNVSGNGNCLSAGGTSCGVSDPWHGTVALAITADDQTKIYGYGDPTLGYTVTSGALESGDSFTGALARTAGENVGYYDITQGTLDVSSASGYVYVISFTNGKLYITPAQLTITARDQGKTYGADYDLGSTSFDVTGLKYSDDVTGVTLTSAGADKAAIVGDYAITPSSAIGTGLSNYNIAFHDGNLTVNRAKLTVTADSLYKSYGSAFSFAGDEYALSGTLYNGDALTGVSLGSAGADKTAIVGGYTITASGATGTGLSNYHIDYVSGIFTVNPAKLTLMARDQSKTYGSTFTFNGDEYTLSGTLYNGDAVTGASLSSFGAPGTAQKGGYDIDISGASGSGLSNYDISYTKGSFTVDPAKLTLTAKNQSKTYGSVFTFAGDEYTLSGTLYNGDVVTGASLSSLGAPGAANKGGYDIGISGARGTGLSNYYIDYAKGTLTVDPAKLTLTAKNQSKTYGSVFTFAGNEYTLSGTLYNGDAVTGANLSSLGASGAAAVSDYDIGVSGAAGSGLSNYDISYAKGTFHVSPAALTLTADDQSKTYGDAFGFAGDAFTLSGTLYNGDTVTGVALASAGAPATAGAGDYAILASGATGSGLSNYNIGYAPGRLRVNPAALTLVADDITKPYGMQYSFSGAEFTSVGLVNGDSAPSGVYLFSPGAPAPANPGSYPVFIGGVFAQKISNYTVSFSNGVMTVVAGGPVSGGVAIHSLGRPFMSVADQTINNDAPFEPFETLTLDTDVSLHLPQVPASLPTDPAALANIAPAAGGASSHGGVSCANSFLAGQPCAE